MDNAAAQINSCKYLYLVDISEPEDNSLLLRIEEASSGTLVEADGPVTHIRPIEHREGDRVFEMLWPSYVGYSIQNESFSRGDENEKFEGNLYRLYAKSQYLNFIAASTIASDDYPGPLKHWGVICLNHTIDVVGTHEPTVRVHGAV